MRKIVLLLCCLMTGPVLAEETVASDVGQAVHKTNRAIGHTTHRTVRAVGHGTRKVTRAIGHGFRDTTRAIGHATRDAAHEATGKDK
jgi:hypothetical protein